ncbi:hypothetical protein CRG98_008922 [Punica granatum]|uniref:Uncharacterized protein n=1 Tax=Punica granatum TaxID=22663 RepID=A0A2I0KQH4_PUNGR|nr:hypothetical protein CRG98_008922 [Punica granatum]
MNGKTLTNLRGSRRRTEQVITSKVLRRSQEDLNSVLRLQTARGKATRVGILPPMLVYHIWHPGSPSFALSSPPWNEFSILLIQLPKVYYPALIVENL